MPRNAVLSHRQDSHELLASINDDFRRRNFGNGEVVITSGIKAQGEEFVTHALAEVQAFDAFTPECDPAGDHGFGIVDVQGKRVCFKFDYYDENKLYGSPNPSDTVYTHRVMTVFRPLEY